MGGLAVCLDGSPAAYHFMKGFGSGSSSWIVHLQVHYLFIAIPVLFFFLLFQIDCGIIDSLQLDSLIPVGFKGPMKYFVVGKCAMHSNLKPFFLIINSFGPF